MFYLASGGTELDSGSGGVDINTRHTRGDVDTDEACVGHSYCVEWNSGGGRCASLILHWLVERYGRQWIGVGRQGGREVGS